MDERVRNAYPLVVAGLVAPKMPKDQSCRAVRVLLATYTSPLIYTATLPKHTKNRDAVLPVAAAGGRPVSDAAVYAPKHLENKQWRTRAVVCSIIGNELSHFLVVLDYR